MVAHTDDQNMSSIDLALFIRPTFSNLQKRISQNYILRFNVDCENSGNFYLLFIVGGPEQTCVVGKCGR